MRMVSTPLNREASRTEWTMVIRQMDIDDYYNMYKFMTVCALTNKSSIVVGSSPVLIIRLLTVMFARLSACLKRASICMTL